MSIYDDYFLNREKRGLENRSMRDIRNDSRLRSETDAARLNNQVKEIQYRPQTYGAQYTPKQIDFRPQSEGMGMGDALWG